MIEVQIGDSRQLIHGLADKSIDCIVTSPPYWGLKYYKTEPIIFDGISDCKHEWNSQKESIHNGRGIHKNLLNLASRDYGCGYD